MATHITIFEALCDDIALVTVVIPITRLLWSSRNNANWKITLISNKRILLSFSYTFTRIYTSGCPLCVAYFGSYRLMHIYVCLNKARLQENKEIRQLGNVNKLIVDYIWQNLKNEDHLNSWHLVNGIEP